MPSGILLWGPPGTGKTLIAEAVAGETSKPFVFVDPGSFKAMFVGVGPHVNPLLTIVPAIIAAGLIAFIAVLPRLGPGKPATADAGRLRRSLSGFRFCLDAASDRSVDGRSGQRGLELLLAAPYRRPQ